MEPRIEIQVGKIRGPWSDVLVERVKKHYVMGIITAHLGPGLLVPSHTTQPEVFSGVWKLTPYAEETARGIKLVGIQAELFPEDFKRVNRSPRRWRFKLVVDKSGVSFFEIEGIAIVGNGYITRTEELMEFFNQHPVVVGMLFISGVIGQSSDNDLTRSMFPTIGKA